MWFTLDTWYAFNTEKIDLIIGYSDSVRIITSSGEVVTFYCASAAGKYNNLMSALRNNFANGTNIALDNTKIEYSTMANIASEMQNVRLYGLPLTEDRTQSKALNVVQQLFN